MWWVCPPEVTDFLDYKPLVKIEPGTDTRYVNIAVPVKFELLVKSYVNGLIREQILRRHQPNLLLYPDEEDNN